MTYDLGLLIGVSGIILSLSIYGVTLIRDPRRKYNKPTI